jgi:hypothetical protein
LLLLVFLVRLLSFGSVLLGRYSLPASFDGLVTLILGFMPPLSLHIFVLNGVDGCYA